MTPTQVLKAEHDGILTMLRVFEKLLELMESTEPVSMPDLESVLSFFREFIDLCHHGKAARVKVVVA